MTSEIPPNKCILKNTKYIAIPDNYSPSNYKIMKNTLQFEILATKTVVILKNINATLQTVTPSITNDATKAECSTEYPELVI